MRHRILSRVLGLLLFLVTPLATAAEGEIALPKPSVTGGKPLHEALATRRSVRTVAATPITLADLGQLVWAAQGVTDGTRRTAPSARAQYPLDVYVVAGAVTGLAAGVWHYIPASHSLVPVRTGDLRAPLVDDAIGQVWVKRAPAIVVLTMDPKRVTAMLGERSERFSLVEIGLAAQNLFLEVVSLGFASTYVGGFDPPKAATVLGLPADHVPVALLPVGRPE